MMDGAVPQYKLLGFSWAVLEAVKKSLKEASGCYCSERLVDGP